MSDLLRAYENGMEIEGGFQKRKKQNNSSAKEKRDMSRKHEMKNYISAAKKGLSAVPKEQKEIW